MEVNEKKKIEAHRAKSAAGRAAKEAFNYFSWKAYLEGEKWERSREAKLVGQRNLMRARVTTSLKLGRVEEKEAKNGSSIRRGPSSAKVESNLPSSGGDPTYVHSSGTEEEICRSLAVKDVKNSIRKNLGWQSSINPLAKSYREGGGDLGGGGDSATRRDI